MSTFNINYGSKNKPLFKKPLKKIEYSSESLNLEQDSIEELSEVQKEIKKAMKNEKDTRNLNTDADYFSQIIFESKEQRNKFYELLGIKETDNQYINGKKLIKALELQIETDILNKKKSFSVNKEILELSIKPNF